jgi:hypothetical protein
MLFSLFFSYGNANTKKEQLTIELLSTLWHVWLLHYIFLLCYSLKMLLLDAHINYGTSTMLKNGTPSLPSGYTLNIDQ